MKTRTVKAGVAGVNSHVPSIKSLNRRSCLAGLGTLGLTGVARADGAHAAFTVIEHNARAGTIEVIHRLMVLDLEIALTARTGQTIRIEDTPNFETLINDYLSDYFSIATSGGEAIDLNWIGAEQMFGSVFVYQEALISENLNGLIVANQMLTETHPSQINTVNVTFGGRTRTRMFTLGDAPETIDLT